MNVFDSNEFYHHHSISIDISFILYIQILTFCFILKKFFLIFYKVDMLWLISKVSVLSEKVITSLSILEDISFGYRILLTCRCLNFYFLTLYRCNSIVFWLSWFFQSWSLLCSALCLTLNFCSFVCSLPLYFILFSQAAFKRSNPWFSIWGTACKIRA